MALQTRRPRISHNWYSVFRCDLHDFDNVLSRFWVDNDTVVHPYRTTFISLVKTGSGGDNWPWWWSFGENPWTWRSSTSVETLASGTKAVRKSCIAFSMSFGDPNLGFSSSTFDAKRENFARPNPRNKLAKATPSIFGEQNGGWTLVWGCGSVGYGPDQVQTQEQEPIHHVHKKIMSN